MTEISVIKEKWSSQTRDPYPEDEWDRGNTSSSWTVDDFIQIYEPDHRRYGWMEMDLDVPFEVTSGTKYYLMYVVYSTGDSFGHDENACIEFCGLYTDISIAQENENRIRAHYDWAKYKSATWRTGNPPKRPKFVPEKYGEFNVMLRTDDGKEEYELHVPWTGYFESMSYLEIKEVQLQLRLYDE